MIKLDINEVKNIENKLFFVFLSEIDKNDISVVYNDLNQKFNENDIDSLNDIISFKGYNCFSLFGYNINALYKIINKLKTINSNNISIIYNIDIDSLNDDIIDFLNENNVTVNVIIKKKFYNYNEDIISKINKLENEPIILVKYEEKFSDYIIKLHKILPNIKISIILDKDKITNFTKKDVDIFCNECIKLYNKYNDSRDWFVLGNFRNIELCNYIPFIYYDSKNIYSYRDLYKYGEFTYKDLGMNFEIFELCQRRLQQIFQKDLESKYNETPLKWHFCEIITNLSCNLRCKYCYEHKNNIVNDFSYIKKFLDCKFEEWDIEHTDRGIIIDLIGGETLLPIDLLEEICSYVKYRLDQINFSNTLRIAMTTNATLITKSKKIQDFLLKWQSYITVGVSIDGCKETHNLNRIYENGIGSYDDAMAGYKWLIEHNIRNNIKATFNYDTIHMYGDGIINLIKNGCREMIANTDINAVWRDEHSEIMINGLKKAIDYIFENNLEKKIWIHKINNRDQFGDVHPISLSVLLNNSNIDSIDHNYCGAGNEMSALGFDGKIYCCNKFAVSDNPHHYAEIINDKIVITDSAFKCKIKEMYKQLKKSECATCTALRLCPKCAAIPIETNTDIVDCINMKRQCGFTKVIIYGIIYFNKKWGDKYAY